MCLSPGAMLCSPGLWQKGGQVYQEGAELAPQQHCQRLRGDYGARAEGHGRAARSGGAGQEGAGGESTADTRREVGIKNNRKKNIKTTKEKTMVK